MLYALLHLKFIKIQLSKKGRIVGAVIEKYLLEKTRINFQTEGERNFHIFYQLLRGSTESMRKEFDLNIDGSTKGYRYLSSSDSIIPSISDDEDFKLTCHCLQNIGIEDNTTSELLAAIAGILHLGNVTFDLGPSDHVGDIAESSKSEKMTSFSPFIFMLFRIIKLLTLTPLSSSYTHL